MGRALPPGHARRWLRRLPPGLARYFGAGVPGRHARFMVVRALVRRAAVAQRQRRAATRRRARGRAARAATRAAAAARATAAARASAAAREAAGDRATVAAARRFLAQPGTLLAARVTRTAPARRTVAGGATPRAHRRAAAAATHPRRHRKRPSTWIFFVLPPFLHGLFGHHVIRQVVGELPTAALLGMLAAAAVAVLMSLGAFLQRRRAHSLDRQRDALLSDVGLLQSALLPAVPPRVGGLDVSVAYRPAAGLAAGGDFFDVFALSDACTGIIVGDVSGHGRESLVQAALARYTLRTLMGEGHPLGEVLTRADRYLAAELEDAFVTVVVAVYDRDTHELRWAKAGHEAPIIAGEPDSHEEPATPLGLGMGETWPEFTHVLQPQQRACLFTDGLVEGRRDGAMVGLERLRTLVEQGLDAQEIVDAVAAGGTDRRDDVAAVVLGRGASPPIIRPGGDHAANTHQRTV